MAVGDIPPSARWHDTVGWYFPEKDSLMPDPQVPELALLRNNVKTLRADDSALALRVSREHYLWCAQHITSTSAWLIEAGWSSASKPDYWRGQYDPWAVSEATGEQQSFSCPQRPYALWTNDHLIAVRFPRKEDAQRVADSLPAAVAPRVCEHSWDMEIVRDIPTPLPIAPQETMREILALEVKERRGPQSYLDMLANKWMEIDNELPPEISAALAAMEKAYALGQSHSPVEWRCYNCGEVFTDGKLAAEHFGAEHSDTACKLNQLEGGLLHLYREANEKLWEYRNECDAQSKEFYSLGADHRTALIREEEKGYARGMADVKAEAATELELVEALTALAKAHNSSGRHKRCGELLSKAAKALASRPSAPESGSEGDKTDMVAVPLAPDAAQGIPFDFKPTRTLMRERIEGLNATPSEQREDVTEENTPPFTRAEWFSFPIEFRKRWWKETDFGRLPLSDELRAALVAALAVRGE